MQTSGEQAVEPDVFSQAVATFELAQSEQSSDHVSEDEQLPVYQEEQEEQKEFESDVAADEFSDVPEFSRFNSDGPEIRLDVKVDEQVVKQKM